MQIGIIGLGVIGGSFAMGLKEAGVNDVYGVDIQQETLDLAQEKGYIKEGYTTPEPLLKNCDIVIITLYPSQVASFFKEHQHNFKKNAIVTDVTGIKTKIIKEIQPLLDGNVDFVFAHPMRGSEKVGFEGADHNRFIGANALITPIPENKEENLQLIEDLYQKIGFELITRVDPKQHDEQIAYVSQLMHVLSVAAVNSAESTHDTMLFAGNSFQELTRIADINGDLWSELFLNNREALLNSIDSFEVQLDKVRKAIEDDSSGSLKEIFNQSSKQRKDWYEFF